MPKAIESPVETAETEVETQGVIDPENVSNSETTVSKADNNPDLREQVKRLYFQGVRPEVICDETGVKRGTLRTWINRYGWLRTVHAAKAMLEKRQGRVLSIKPAPQSGASNSLRDTFASVLQKAASKMDTIDPKANLKDLRKVGKALEPLVRSAKIVHGWGNESTGGVVVAELLGHEREQEQQAISVTADVKQLPCGLDTPTGSVPAPCGIEQKPQEPK